MYSLNTADRLKLSTMFKVKTFKFENFVLFTFSELSYTNLFLYYIKMGSMTLSIMALKLMTFIVSDPQMKHRFEFNQVYSMMIKTSNLPSIYVKSEQVNGEGNKARRAERETEQWIKRGRE
jgi:hypothetical protein